MSNKINKRNLKQLREIGRREAARNAQLYTFMTRHNCDLKCKTAHQRKAEVVHGLVTAVVWN